MSPPSGLADPALCDGSRSWQIVKECPAAEDRAGDYTQRLMGRQIISSATIASGVEGLDSLRLSAISA